MSYLAGIDIGNATTEVAIADITKKRGIFIGSGIAETSGLKGTIENIPGVVSSLEQALKVANISLNDLSLILINNAAPVIGDVAMEAISETIIQESSVVGHNPDTPGGDGLGKGITILLEDIKAYGINKDRNYVVIISSCWDFEKAAYTLNAAMENGFLITAAIVQKDDAVLIYNRLNIKIPIIDEVKYIERIPSGIECAVEVAKPGYSISTLSNPFGLATIFRLTSEETMSIATTAKVLSGKRSAVVLRTSQGKVSERRIPSGKIEFVGIHKKRAVDVEKGARKIMDVQKKMGSIVNIEGESNTNVGKMFSNIRHIMASLTDLPIESIKLKDLIAADTFVYKAVEGGIANELTTEKAVGIAAMVNAKRLQMQKVANALESEIGCKVVIEGVEAEMALKGALTTPGASIPMAVLDLGAGSTDGAFIDDTGEVKSAHVAGAGDLVTMLINTELGLNDKKLAEEIKRNPLAKVESFSQIRHEDGSLQYLDEMPDPKFFGRNVIIKSNAMILVPSNASLETIQRIRRDAKKKIFEVNALRVLEKLISNKNLKCVVLVGGSALDFEIPNMLTNVFLKFGIVAGQANVRGTEGPRNAVATGLLIKHLETQNWVGVA